jgi:spore coat protein A
MTRREIVRLFGMALPFSASSCLRPRPESKVLPSLASLPAPFQASLPIPPAAAPSHTDSGADHYQFTVQPGAVQILPGLTTQIWGYNGTFPGPTIEARRGRRVALRLRNQLPVPIVNHLHGGRTAPESDGYPTDFVLPTIGFPVSHMHDALARVSDGDREYVYENDQRAATLWYHDHRMDFTAPQVWRGLAGFYILRDPDEDRLPLPRGDREIPLMICDRSFEADGSFRYPVRDPLLRVPPAMLEEYMGGVLGDAILVNGAPWPRLEVANVKYRFRILNASNARRYELVLDPVPRGAPPFTQIASDGGLLEVPVEHQTIRIAPAERFDVIVDFSKFRIGSSVTLRNLADSGRTGQIMRFNVSRSARDDSTIPTKLSDPPDIKASDAAVIRDFDFSFRRFHPSGMMNGWTINGQPFDPARMDARPRLDTTEIWRLQTDFSHPLHLHLVHFRVLTHSGRPAPYDSGWKDTLDLSPGQAAEILVRFSGYRGRYVFHCHNLEHEDMSMMANFEVV